MRTTVAHVLKMLKELPPETPMISGISKGVVLSVGIPLHKTSEKWRRKYVYKA